MAPLEARRDGGTSFPSRLFPSQEMSWDPTGSHRNVVPDAIPIPHSRRHEVIGNIRSSSSREDSDAPEKSSRKSGPKRDASTMTDLQQPSNHLSNPSCPKNRVPLDGEAAHFK
ncbi:uncharacterized protein LOC144098244 [Amblyomma americanum]